jgi:hypothetical protein
LGIGFQVRAAYFDVSISFLKIHAFRRCASAKAAEQPRKWRLRLAEILAVCDRIAVFRAGRIVDVLDGATASEEQIIGLAISGKANK